MEFGKDVLPHEGSTNMPTKETSNSPVRMDTEDPEDVVQSSALRGLVQTVETILKQIPDTNKTRVSKACEQFSSLNPPTFQGHSDPQKAQAWLLTIERIFTLLQITDDNLRMAIAPCYLRDKAATWWATQENIFGQFPLPWTAFCTLFVNSFIKPTRSAKRGKKTHRKATLRTASQTSAMPTTPDNKGRPKQHTPPPLAVSPLRSKIQKGVCYNCGKYGHLNRNCPLPQSCRLCKNEGHKQSSCPSTVCHSCHTMGHMQSHCPKKLS